MLIDERKNAILKLVNKNGKATVQELMELFDASESTIRRDLTELDEKQLLVKVHGGALASSKEITKDISVSEREILNRDSKITIAQYAASLITDKDVVYLDAGTSTGYIIEYISASKAVFVTNAIAHARKLCNRGFEVYLPGGMVKMHTEALIGADTCEAIQKFHFTKGFFGSNGLTIQQGCTTPDVQEAKVKESAFAHCKESYILCDSSKFGVISSVTFADFTDCIILTDSNLSKVYQNYDNIKII